MPSMRRRRAAVDDEEENGDDSSTPYVTGQTTRRSPKQRRLDPSSDNDSDGTDGAQLGNGLSSQDFQPGAIVRVSVKNFVTYEQADFFPGPHLNMVIGPNGTGKSSLVCAICLGLGYSPKHLGRAGSVKEFVKHGKDTATIEIELKRKPQDRQNYTIRVQIRREQNNQKWWLNSKETTLKTIQNLMRSLKIQVDNLCQFLPQDRVVEFAASTPVDLLRETLRAAAPEEMLHWQSQLQEMHKHKKELLESSQTDGDTLRNLENRQQGLQADVDRIREREEIQQNVRNLKNALIMSQYSTARNKYAEARERKKTAAASLKRLEDSSGPSLEAVNLKQEYARRVKNAVDGRGQAVDHAGEKADSLVADIEQLDQEIKNFENRRLAEKATADKKRKELFTCKAKITQLQGELNNTPSTFNAADWNQKIRAEEHVMRELEAQGRQIDSRVLECQDRGRILKQRQQQLVQELEALDTQQGKQLTLLRNRFPEVAEAWSWLEKNQDQFEKPVFGPPMISCSVKDERYSDQVESLLQQDDFLCFTVQTKNDYRKLSDRLIRDLSLSVSIRSCSQPFEAFQRPTTEEQLMALGLEKFGIDVLEGPAPVLAMLCAEKRLHMTGLSLREHTDAQYNQLAQNSQISQWTAGRQSFMVRRRKEYGPNAMTTITKNIQPGRIWTSQPIDAGEKQRLQDQLTLAQGEWAELKEENSRARAELDDLRIKQGDVTEKITQLKAEKGQLQRESQKWQALPSKIEAEERQKQTLEQTLQDMRQTIIEIQYEWDDTVLRRAELALKHQVAIQRIHKARQDYLEARIQYIEAFSEIDGLKNRNANIMQRLEEEKQNVQTAAAEAERAKDEGRAIGEQIQAMLQAEGDERRDLYASLAENKTPEQIEIEIDAEDAKLELIHAANPNAIREFEKRNHEINKIKRKMDNFNEKLRQLTAELDGVMGKFEPELDNLISKINDAFAYNFEQINCAGEVRVHKEEDLELWAIDIMVRFRENETLQQLNAHRQSGGERAVSTIFYLMALQSMAQSPFRVVDEINQGMDPRNERMVHERMVEIACREHSSQYFLITPKLLTGLRYDSKMRVLCIASGEHMPREGKKLDFARCLKVQRELLAAAA